ncbi:MAG: DUF362 domain-containing protein [Candidatus Omnitrophota bacterium]
MRKTQTCSRRNFLKATSIGIVAAGERSVLTASNTQIDVYPIVGVDRCRRYDFAEVKNSLSRLFDWIGGAASLVKGKTVAIKVNLTSYRSAGVYTLSTVETVYTHPIVVLAACALFQDYGARRIVICESNPTNDETRESFNRQYYDVALFESMIQNLEWENTRNKGTGSRYMTMPVGDGAYFYKSFDLNHRYYDTDVFVSIAKMKNHDIAGITLTMKNLFGIAPNAIYGDPGNEQATTIRNMFHNGKTRPAADGEILPVASNDPGYRIPRIVVDLNRARPIDLAIIDGITAQMGGEGAWNGAQIGFAVPHVLIAGQNCVAVDAVGAAIMGFDPLAEDFSKPFYNAANTLRLAAEQGLGSNNLNEIDVVGLSVKEARYNYLPGKKNR